MLSHFLRYKIRKILVIVIYYIGYRYNSFKTVLVSLLGRKHLRTLTDRKRDILDISYPLKDW